jgi:hypothetical protein
VNEQIVHYQCEAKMLPANEFIRSVLWLLVTANVAPSSPILATLMIEGIYSSETSVRTRAAQCNIPEGDILHSHRRKYLKSYIALTGWALLQRIMCFL